MVTTCSSSVTASACACSPATATTGAAGFRSLPKLRSPTEAPHSCSTAKLCCLASTAGQISTGFIRARHDEEVQLVSDGEDV